MSTLFLEHGPGGFRGWSRDLFIHVKLLGSGGLHVTGRTREGEPAFEWNEPTVEEMMSRLCEQEEVERIVCAEPDGTAKVHRGRLERPLPPEELSAGSVSLPPFGGLQGAPWAHGEGFSVLSAAAITSVEYLRVGAETGSVVYTLSAGVAAAFATSIEPGAVLMSVFHASPDDARRLGAEVAEPH